MFYNMLRNNYSDDLIKCCQDRVRESRKRIGGYREELYATKVKQLRVEWHDNIWLFSNNWSLFLNKTLEQTFKASNAVGEKSKGLKLDEILQKIHRRIGDDDAEDQLCKENSVTHFQVKEDL